MFAGNTMVQTLFGVFVENKLKKTTIIFNAMVVLDGIIKAVNPTMTLREREKMLLYIVKPVKTTKFT